MILTSRNLLFLMINIVLFSTNPSQGCYVVLGDYYLEETPLMKAAQQAKIEEMKELIKAGAYVNEVAFRDQPHGGYPVLRYAIDSGCLQAVQILLEAGANLHDFTESPIIYDDFNCKANVRNLSLLSHAVNSGAPICIIKELLNKGAHIDGAPKICGDWSPLMIAAYRGNIEAVIILLQAGAEVDSINAMDQKTALDYAKEENHVEIIKILQDHNCKIIPSVILAHLKTYLLKGIDL